ncbi:MAG: phosphatidylglycerophosphatase A, partial [Opitutales bacterium]
MTEDRRSDVFGWATFLATLGPVGKCPVAPGTAGSLVGFAAYLFAGYVLKPPDHVYWILCALLPLLAVPLCHAAEKFIGRKDPPEIVLDEFAVVPLCFLGTINPSGITSTNSPKIFVWFLGGFVL